MTLRGASRTQVFSRREVFVSLLKKHKYQASERKIEIEKKREM